MRVNVPDAVGSGAVSSEEGHLRVRTDADGTRYVETEADATAERIAANWERAHDGYVAATGPGETESDDAGTCQHVVERTGETCGRDLPCQYHTEDG